MQNRSNILVLVQVEIVIGSKDGGQYVKHNQDEPLIRASKVLRPLVRRSCSCKSASRPDGSPIELFFRPRQVSKLELVPLPWQQTGL
jgi:hypothetical protein